MRNTVTGQVVKNAIFVQSICFVIAFLLFLVSVALPADTKDSSATLRDDLVAAIARISQTSNKNIVSAIPLLVSSEEYNTDLSQASNIDQLSQSVGGSSTFRYNTNLFYRITPDWYKSQVESGRSLSFFYELSQFLDASTAMQRENLLNVGTIESGSLADSQKRNLENIFTEWDISGENKDDLRLRLKTILSENVSPVKFRFDPQVFLYKKHLALGVIKFAANEKPRFRQFEHESDDRFLGTAEDWKRVPTLIEPSVTLPEAVAARFVTFKVSAQIWTLQELALELNRNTTLALLVDKRLQNVQIVTGGKDWNVGELMRSVCTVAGCEMRQVGNATFLTPSKLHDFVASRVDEVNQQEVLALHILKMLSPRFQKVLQPVVAPLRAEHFLSPAVKSEETLLPPERDFLSKLAGEPLNDSFQVRFLLFVHLYVGSGTQQMTTNGSLNFAENSYGPTRKPEGSEWSAYDSPQILNDFKAQVIR